MTRQDQQVSVSPGERLAVCEILDDVTDPGGPRMRGRTTQNPEREERRMRSGTGAPRDERRPEVPDDRAYGERDYRGISSHQPLRAQWDPTKREVGRTPRNPRPDRAARKQSKLGRFVSTYGWRAYAIPVLVVLTILVIVDAVRPDATDSASKTSATADLAHSTDGTDVIGAPPAGDGTFASSIPSGALPDGGPFTVAGGGTWHVVPGTTGKVGQGTEREFTYTVEIEDGVDTTGFGGDESYGRMVDQTLANPKSWTNDPKVAFRRVDAGEPDFRISLTLTDDDPRRLWIRNRTRRILLQPEHGPSPAQRTAMGARRHFVPGRHRLVSAVSDQSRGRPCHRIRRSSAVRDRRRTRTDHDAADLRNREQRHR